MASPQKRPYALTHAGLRKKLKVYVKILMQIPVE